MRTFTAVATLMLFASPVLADTSDGTRNWSANADHANHGDVSATTLAENTAHRRAIYDALVQDGGCGGDVIPVEYSTPCAYGSFGKQTESGGDSPADSGASTTQ